MKIYAANSKYPLAGYGLALTLLLPSLTQAESRWFLDVDMGLGKFTDSPSGEHFDLHEVGKPGVSGLRVGKTFAVGDEHQVRAYVLIEGQNVEAESSFLGISEGAKRDTGLFGVGVNYQHSLTESWYLSTRGELGWYSDELELFNKELATGTKISRSYKSDGNFAGAGVGIGYRFNENWHTELGVRKQFLFNNEYRDDMGESARYSRSNQGILSIGYTF